MKNDTVPPPGFRDLLPPAAGKRRALEHTLAGVFEAEGFGEVRPPSVEHLALYQQGRQHAAAAAYRFLDRDDRLLALRADFTPAVARAVAARPPGAGEVRKHWYAGSVIRRTASSGGRYHEISQAGAEVFGTHGPEEDADVIRLLLRCLDRLGVHDVTVHVSHAGIAAELLARVLPDPERAARARRDILRRDAQALTERLRSWDVADPAGEALRALAGAPGGPSPEARIGGIAPGADRAQAALRAILGSLPPAETRVVPDLGELDELEYYTGVIFTVYHGGAPEPLGRGGRYDGLLGAFGLDLPAIGFSLALDQLAELI